MSQVPAVPPNNTLLISLVTVVCIAVIGGILLKRYAYRFLPPMEEPEEEFELPAYQDLPPVYQCNEEFVDAGLTGSTDISGEIAAAVTVPIEP